MNFALDEINPYADAINNFHPRDLLDAIEFLDGLEMTPLLFGMSEIIDTVINYINCFESGVFNEVEKGDSRFENIFSYFFMENILDFSRYQKDPGQNELKLFYSNEMPGLVKDGASQGSSSEASYEDARELPESYRYDFYKVPDPGKYEEFWERKGGMNGYCSSDEYWLNNSGLCEESEAASADLWTHHECW